MRELLERAHERLFLAGSWEKAHGGVMAVESPSDATQVASVGRAGPEDLDLAVARAQDARGLWRMLPSLERGRILARAAESIRAHDQEIAQLIGLENGMPAGAARFIEVPMAADTFDYYAGLSSRPMGRVVPFNLPGSPPRHLVFTVDQPVGVAGMLTPWNFPLLMPAWKLAAALAAGCPVILKPAPETPLSALYLAQLLHDAGLPEGVLSVLPGGDDLGEHIVRHPGVAKIALTGGTDTGRAVLAQAAPLLKRVSLELGGKSPLLLFEDADVDAACDAALFGIFFNSGQVCQASSRVLVHRSLYQRFVDRLVERAAALRVGPASDDRADLGPVITRERLQAIDAHVQAARSDGARILTGGHPLAGPGYFYPPTVVTEASSAAPIAKEEIFGPVVVVLPFASEAEAVELANATAYGLAAAIWTRDVRRALSVALAIEAGTVWINTIQVLTPTAPFGGFKASGIGRDLGEEGLRQYVETKTVIVDLNDWPMAYF